MIDVKPSGQFSIRRAHVQIGKWCVLLGQQVLDDLGFAGSVKKEHDVNPGL
jgi:hypothetical protein